MTVADRCVALAHQSQRRGHSPPPEAPKALSDEQVALAIEHLCAGLDAADSGDVKPAEVLFHRAEALVPHWHLPLAELARLAARQGAWKDAKIYADAAKGRCNDSHLATVAAVAAAQHLEGHDAAEALAEKALIEQPTNTGVYHWLAAFRQLKGMSRAAQELWRLALFTNPHDPQAQLALALSLAKRGRRREVESLLVRCARLLPEEPAVTQLESWLGA
jgi:Tfp pilus assembly protein PilF